MQQQAGGGKEQPFSTSPHLNVPAQVKQNQPRAKCFHYRKTVIADGIIVREDGLFPPGDQLLQELQQLPNSHPFEKHLVGEKQPVQQLPKGGWATGNTPAKHGLDLRLFYQGPSGGARHGTVTGAVRLGDAAAIGNGFWMPAHGGAIETVLDEATAELAKMDVSPLIATSQISFKLLKAVPLHTSLRVECQMKNVTGIKCAVTGKLLDQDGTVLATCEAELVDLQAFL